MPRKPKPTVMFREEVTYEPPLERMNSTRQTFDRAQYEAWREYSRRYPSTGRAHRYFIATITWEDA